MPLNIFGTHSNRAQIGYSYNNGRIYPNIHYRYMDIIISESLKDFFYNRCNSHSSTACYYLKSFILKELDYESSEKIDNEVFSKINSISESDNGYVIINNNQKIKIGKLVVKVGGVVKINTDDKSEATGIEKFVDDYKSWYKTISNLKFKILKGKDILNGYDRSCQIRSRGMLSGSCMNDQPYLLNLYVDNEEKVELLTLVDDNDKIYGRSLLWKIDNRPFIFMDRVYGADNYINNIFNQYARDSKMAYREQNQLYDFELYLPSGETTNSEKFPLKVKLQSKHLKYLPYMDSLYIWNKWSDVFSTAKTESFMKFHRLKSTSGGIGKPGLKILGIKIKNDD